MTTDINAMTPREMCAALMRGSRLDMRRGYGAEASAMTAADHKSLSAAGFRELLAFAHGFADGMATAIEASDPSTSFDRFGETKDEYLPPYADGYHLGEQEDGFTLYPTLKTDYVPRSRKERP